MFGMLPLPCRTLHGGPTTWTTTPTRKTIRVSWRPSLPYARIELVAWKPPSSPMALRGYGSRTRTIKLSAVTDHNGFSAVEACTNWLESYLRLAIVQAFFNLRFLFYCMKIRWHQQEYSESDCWFLPPLYCIFFACFECGRVWARVGRRKTRDIKMDPRARTAGQVRLTSDIKGLPHRPLLFSHFS